VTFFKYTEHSADERARK